MLIPFSLMWGGFAIFWEWSVVHQAKAPGFFSLWGIPFVLIGLYLIAGRFFVDAWVRANTYYAATNQCILIVRTAPTTKFIALAIDRLPELSLDERQDGRGTISFQTTYSGWNNRGFSGWTPSLDGAPKFLAIADARNVFSQIQRLSNTRPA
jgi:hypothetical protein